MLNIYFGEMPEADFPNYVYNTSVYFDNTYLDAWITDEFSQKMIKNIDQANVISPNAVDSRALGVIPVKQLSGGVKTLLLIQHDSSKIFNASTCGDNCAKWILKLAKRAKEREILKILDAPFDYIESKEHFSWEQFFTALLVEKTEGTTYLKYSKNSINKAYLNAKEQAAIINVMPDLWLK